MEKIDRILHKNGQRCISYYMGDRKQPIDIICTRCQNIWYSYPYEIRKGRKCPYCNESSGERTIRYCLEIMLIPYCKEVYTGIGMTRFDFLIRDYTGRYCVIEFDGKQHTEHVKYFHRTKRSFMKAKQRDMDKMNHALRLGYRILRISYKSEKYAGSWIWKLLNSNDQVIYSD